MTHREKAECECEAAENASFALPNALNPGQFSTPQSKPPIPSAASTPNLDAESLTPSSSIGCSPLSTTSSSTLTPNLDSMKLGHVVEVGLIKKLLPLIFLTFCTMLQKKNKRSGQKGKIWRGGGMQKRRVPKVMNIGRQKVNIPWSIITRKRRKKAQATQGSQGNASQEVVDIQDDIDDGDVVVTGQGQAERSKELSRQR